MSEDDVYEIQRLYPQIYLACHVDHVRAVSTQYRISAQDASVLSHLDREYPLSPRELARHLGVAASTLSATVSRLERLGYITSAVSAADKRRRELRLTAKGAEASASTSVLDSARVRAMLNQLSVTEREEALRGFSLLAAAARLMQRAER